MSTITVKANNKVQTIAEHKVVTKDGTPTIIKAVNNTNYEILDESTGRAPNHIITKRIDKNLHLSFENDSETPDLIIEGFYDDADSALIGMAEDGSYYYYIPDSGEVADYVTELEIGDIQGQALGGNAQATPWWIGATETEGFDALPWLAGLAGVGLLGAALGSSSSSNSDNNKPPVDNTAPDAPTDLEVSADGSIVTGKGEPGANVEITDPNGDVIGEGVVNDNGDFEVGLNPPQVDGEEIEATLTDKAGNASDSTNVTAPDITAPDAPTDLVVSEDGGTVTGKGEPGANVEITDPNGDVIGEGVVDENGNFNVDLVPPQVDGEEIEATLTDPAGNTSDATNVTAPDITAPDAPTEVTIGNGDAFITADEIDAKGNIDVVVGLPDNAEVGDTLIVSGNGEVIKHVLTQVDLDNTEVTVQLPAPDEDATLDVTASLSDPAGNMSDPTNESFKRDTIAPDDTSTFITIDSLTDDNVINKAESEGNVAVTGTVEGDFTAGDIVTVTVNGQNYESTVSADGTFSVAVPGNDLANDSQVVVTVTATDAAGNVGQVSENQPYEVDLVAPDAPTEVTIGNGDEYITADEIINGKVDVVVGLPENAEADDILNVNGKEQVLTEEDIINGEVIVKIEAPAEGESLDVSASLKDPSGNTSGSITNSFERDTTAPDGESITINIDPLTDDNVINKAESKGEVTVTGTIEGDFTAGDTVTVTVNGQEYGSTVSADGTFSIAVSGKDLANDSQVVVTITATDAAGNVGNVSKSQDYDVDLVAPSAPTSIVVGNDDGFLNEEEIDADNNVEVVIGLPDDAKAGDTVIVNGKEQVLTPDDIANKEVTVKVPAPIEGDSLDITATIKDVAGNESPKLTENVGVVDTTAPDAPTSDFIITDNVANDGSGDVLDPPEVIQAGDVTNDNTPSITIPADTLGADETAQLIVDDEMVEATIVENADGSITLTPNDALTDGAHDLSYNLKDAAGNTSANG
ncbi:Ig-like domain-containing protein, partial [Psychrobacter sp.]|uniref:Ig-like domain-containing protein n=1 Tax=Psychrobacter sp. TaxID=56811 RepID=UPI002FD8BCFD